MYRGCGRGRGVTIPVDGRAGTEGATARRDDGGFGVDIIVVEAGGTFSRSSVSPKVIEDSAAILFGQLTLLPA